MKNETRPKKARLLSWSSFLYLGKSAQKKIRFKLNPSEIQNLMRFGKRLRKKPKKIGELIPAV